MEFIYIILAIVTTIGTMVFFLKTTTDSFNEVDGFEIDKENVEKSKVFFTKTMETLKIKTIFAMTLGEVFKFIQELPSRSARALWNVRKELMLTMLLGIVFFASSEAGYTYTPYIVTGLVALVIYFLRKTGHLKNSETEDQKDEEKEVTDVPDYKNMEDIQVGIDMAKRFIKKAYDLSIGATLKFAGKIITREGRKTLVLEQELILVALTTIPYVYFGWVAFKITLIYIAGNYLVEILRGKVETSEELKKQVSEKTAELEKVKVENEAKLTTANKQIDTLKVAAVEIAGMSKKSNRIDALEKLDLIVKA